MKYARLKAEVDRLGVENPPPGACPGGVLFLVGDAPVRDVRCGLCGERHAPRRVIRERVIPARRASA